MAQDDVPAAFPSRRMPGLLWALVLALIVPASFVPAADARECRGVLFPDSGEIGGTRVTLNGLGVRKATIFKVNVYVAALYVSVPSHDPHVLLGTNAPARVTMHFLRDVNAGELRKKMAEGFANSSPALLPVLRDRMAKLDGWLTDMRSGQRLTFTHLPEKGVEVEINGRTRGTILGDDFAQAFLSVLLGDRPPNPELKSGLLGGPCN